MRKIGLVMFVVTMLAGCSALTKQETTASNIPSAQTLTLQCAAGAKQTPPIRAGACDDFNLVQQGCITSAMNPLTASGAVIACSEGGYITSGNWTRL